MLLLRIIVCLFWFLMLFGGGAGMMYESISKIKTHFKDKREGIDTVWWELPLYVFGVVFALFLMAMWLFRVSVEGWHWVMEAL